MLKRKQPTLHEKLAAALLQLAPSIDREWAKTKTAKQICSMFDCHHVVYVATKPNNHPTNLHMMPTAEHKERTRKIDIPAIAKGKRIEKEAVMHRSQMALKANAAIMDALIETDYPKFKHRWPKWSKMQSRGFQKK